MLELAAGLILVTALAHSWLGERNILLELCRREDLPKLLGSAALTAGTLRFAWHLTTVAWCALAALVLGAAGGPATAEPPLRVVAITCLVSAALPLYFTRGRHPAWVAFLVVAGLLWEFGP